MKLLRLRADGFGALKGEFTFDSERATIIVGDNERGKSTLLAAVNAGLYGLASDKRNHRLLTPLERWRPWNGGTYRLVLEVECGTERYTIARDFDRGTVEIRNGRGQEVTTDFREGKDDFPVGKKLLGLDGDEFNKCAHVGQGELEEVVPTDEKERRASTLRSRLENAADTRLGDTNASESLRVLEQALRRYNSVEVEFTGTVEVAMQRLEAKRGILETEMKALEHDFASIAGPLEQLAQRTEQAAEARAELNRLENERRGSLAADVRSRLDEDTTRRKEVERMRAEAKGLAAAADLPANAESDFRDTVARLEIAQRNLQGLEDRRREQIARDRGTILIDLEKLPGAAKGTDADADRAIALAAELRRVTEEDRVVRDNVFSLRETLARHGHEPERIQFLTGRFGKLDDDEQHLLRTQAEVTIAFQTEVALLEQLRTEGSEALRAIDASRTHWRMPGWLVLTLGLASAVTGGTLFSFQISGALAPTLLAAGGALGVIGVVVLVAGGRLQASFRTEALHQLADAQARLNQLRMKRAETEVGLAELALRMNYRDQVELLREWSEYTRLMEESSPVLHAQDQIVALDDRRRNVAGQARQLLDKIGGGAADPAGLDAVAANVRTALGLKQKLAELEKSWSWIDEEKRVAEALANGLMERASRALQSAGLAHDPERSWAEHANDLAERARGRARYSLLTDELIPQTERSLLADRARRELENRLQEIESELGQSDEAPRGRPAGDIEADIRKWRGRLEETQQLREDLRIKVEEIWRRYHTEHPQKTIEKERIEQALERTRRFKHSVDLARETIQKVATETHRRWADYLNHRVAQLLGAFGTRIEQMRFGEDLDFSVRLWSGQNLPRPKADHQLSAGARDQLYLTVRLAIAEFLSRGQPAVPLLLDDPFVTSDDDRARGGMRLLIEHFTREHQVILMTCHRRRYQALAEQDAELYTKRARWLDFRDVEVAS